MIDNKTTPRYQQLKDQIVKKISCGELQPHDRVSSENELAGASGVSRMTANRALRELTDEGYLERVAGKGTFVADFRSRSHVLDVQNIATEIKRRGHSYTCKVLRHSRQHARGDVARALRVAQGTDVFHIVIVHFENDVPVQAEDRHILAEFAPDCLQRDFAKMTPSAYLTSIAPLQEAEQLVRASLPNKAMREQLQMAENEPSLVLLRRTWADGRPVSFARLQHPGSRYELTGHYTPPGAPVSALSDVADIERLWNL